MKLTINFIVLPGELYESEISSDIYEVIEVGQDYVEIRRVPTNILTTITPEQFFKKLRKIG